jgi:hypothetical protein
VLLKLTNLEGTLFESNLEVIGLSSKDDLVDVELIRSADDRTITELLGAVCPSKMLAWNEARATKTKKLTP